MRALDERSWEQQRRDILGCADGQLYLDVLDSWVSGAENLLDVGDVRDGVLYRYRPAEALREALAATEQAHGRIEPWLLGQYLCLLLAHWSHSPQLDLTPIEMALVSDALAHESATLGAEHLQARST